MDGNGRWATEQNLPRLEGHAAGETAFTALVHQICDVASEITTLTVFAFAKANWKREQSEIDGLFDLFRKLYIENLDEFNDRNVRVTPLGEVSELPEDIQEKIAEGVEKTKNNTGLHVQIAVNYDGLNEAVRATKQLAAQVAAGELAVETIDETVLRNALDTKGDADADIVIRTGMKKGDAEKGMAVWRPSGFLTLQSTQAVCVSVEKYWPDFTYEDLVDAITVADLGSELFGGQRQAA